MSSTAAHVRPTAPDRPAVVTVAVATMTSSVALGSLVLLGLVSGHVLLIPPMAASMALVAGAPTLPLAQPRNVVGGQVVSALVGVAVGGLGHSLWWGALAGALALGAMLLTRTAHSPAAATAVLGTQVTEGAPAFVLCAGLAAGVLVVVGLARARAGGQSYPVYWW